MKGLALPHIWVLLGQNEQAIWGECQGRGKTPYQTQIDLSELAFKCSCPSRKFPCKHGLGLFLLSAEQPTAFTQDTPPSWVTQWINSRNEKRAKKEETTKESPPPVNTTAQAKRAEKREAKVTDGVQELERWLKDLVRQGLAAAQGQPYSFWDGIAARMVDAQAPGLARQLRDMGSIPASGASRWQERLLQRLSRLHLLIEGYKRLETLPPETQADIRTLIGWTQKEEELVTKPGVRDCWYVVGQRTEQEEQLKVQRSWLWGEKSGKTALILNFAYGSQPLDTSLVPGRCLDAELVFYASAYPVRAIVKTRYEVTTAVAGMPSNVSTSAVTEIYTNALARNPWIEQLVVAVQNVIPLRHENHWVVRDSADQLLPLAPWFDQGWQLMALSAGHPITLFGEWNGEFLHPLSVWAEGKFVIF